MKKNLCILACFLLSLVCSNAALGPVVGPNATVRGTNIALNLRAFGAWMDGVTNDAVPVQDALNALQNGQELQIDKVVVVGTNGWNGLYLTNKTNVTISALGNSAGFILAYAPTQTVEASVFMLRIANCSNVVIRGLSGHGSNVVSGFIGMDNCVNSTIDGCSADRFAGIAGFMIVGGNDILIKDNIAKNGSGASTRGFWIGNNNTGKRAKYYRVAGNIAQDNAATGFGGIHDRCTFVNNISVRNGGSGFALAGATGEQTLYSVYTGNIAVSNAFHGFQSDPSYATNWPTGVSIVGNTIQSNAVSGVYAVQCDQWTIQGNVISDNNIDGSGTGRGVQLDRAHNINIVGNTIYDSSYTNMTGIYLDAQSTAASITGISIFGNNISNCIDGIKLTRNAAPGYARAITVIGNTVRGCSHGIVINFGYTNAVVIGNTSIDNIDYDFRHDANILAVNNLFSTENVTYAAERQTVSEYFYGDGSGLTNVTSSPYTNAYDLNYSMIISNRATGKNSDFIVSGKTQVGAVSSETTAEYTFRTNQNAGTQLVVENGTDGTGAYASLWAISEANAGIFSAYSPSHSTYPDSVGVIETAGAGNGLFLQSLSGNVQVRDSLEVSNTVSATFGYYMPTNALTSWPASPRTHGESFWGNSNGVIYVLTSVPGALTWAATNKIAP